MIKQLQAAFQYYADKGLMMTVRRKDTEEITFLGMGGEPLHTLRTEPVSYITDMWETRELDDNYVSTTLVCDHIPPIEQFETVWGRYRGARNVLVPDIKIHKGYIRDLSKEQPVKRESVVRSNPQIQEEITRSNPVIQEKVTRDNPMTPEEVLPYMRKEDGWTDEMIDAVIKDIQNKF
jgi:hypothetical protein